MSSSGFKQSDDDDDLKLWNEFGEIQNHLSQYLANRIDTKDCNWFHLNSKWFQCQNESDTVMKDSPEARVMVSIVDVRWLIHIAV